MKDLSKTVAIREFIAAFSLFRHNFGLVVCAAIIDALFFVAYGFFTGGIRDKIVEYGILLANKLSLEHVATGFFTHIFSPDFFPLTSQLLILLGLFFIVFFSIYIIFQGASWYLACSITKKQPLFWHYLLGFSRVNLFFSIIAAVIFLSDLLYDMRHTIVKALVPSAVNYSGFIVIPLGLLLFATALFSYPTLHLLTLYRNKPLFAAFGIVLCILLATQYLLGLLGTLNQQFALLIALIVFFPIIILLKIYTAKVTYVYARA